MTIVNKKTFDAVEMKNQIQAKILATQNELGEAESDRQRREWLQTSNDTLAIMWREMLNNRPRDK
jgi:hypothetical protein